MKIIKISSWIFALVFFSLQVFADEYIIKKGDSVRKILLTHGFKGNEKEMHFEVQKVVKQNVNAFKNGDPNTIYPGTVLILNNYIPELEPEPEQILLPVIGKMNIERGEAKIIRSEETQTVIKTSDLYTGDKVITLSDALTKVEMNDGTLYELGPYTEFSIDDYYYSDDQNSLLDKAGRVTTTLIRGVVRAITGKIGQHDKKNFQFKTVIASIGIRGTDYTVRYCDGNNCGALTGTSVAVVDGGINLKNSSGEISLDKGEFARVESANSKPFSAPMPAGFLDLDLDVADVKVSDPSWWSKLINFFEF